MISGKGTHKISDNIYPGDDLEKMYTVFKDLVLSMPEIYQLAGRRPQGEAVQERIYLRVPKQSDMGQDDPRQRCLHIL